VLKKYKMAEGGYDDPDLDSDIDHDDDDTDDNDDDTGDEQEVHRNKTFRPGQASTPYHGGENVEMQTMGREKTGLPPSYQETSFSESSPLLGAQYEAQKSWDALARVFPEASATSLETFYSKTHRLQAKMAGFGKKLYHLFTKNMNIGQEQLNPNLPKEIKNALTKGSEQIIAEDRDKIQEQSRRLEEAE